MAVKSLKCERCGDDAHYREPCTFCKRMACRNCQKSSLTASKTERLIICKDCWAKPGNRRAYKSA